MKIVKFYLRSGAVITFECETFNITYAKEAGGQLTGYSINGGRGDVPLWANMTDVNAITTTEATSGEQPLQEALLQEAIDHIQCLVDGEHCAWGAERKAGETCREFRTRQQGVPCAGCFECEARDFLKKVGAAPPR
jgi:hypothetical protein